jgi:hypothetical protein|tara:strand:+ start:106 stop:282 length:177 start_codon:yes stop_codon:yes gene_type:complete
MVLNNKGMNGGNQDNKTYSANFTGELEKLKDINKSEAFIEFVQKEEISFVVFVESMNN